MTDDCSGSLFDHTHPARDSYYANNNIISAYLSSDYGRTSYCTVQCNNILLLIACTIAVVTFITLVGWFVVVLHLKISTRTPTCVHHLENGLSCMRCDFVSSKQTVTLSWCKLRPGAFRSFPVPRFETINLLFYLFIYNSLPGLSPLTGDQVQLTISQERTKPYLVKLTLTW